MHTALVSPALRSHLPEVGARLSPRLLAAEVDWLPADQLLLEHRDHWVFSFYAHQAPALTWEIGRLRELTFRAIGEGSGRELDLDRYDGWYQHLFVWDRVGASIVGAYRLGPTEVIVHDRGVEGLYTRSLWYYTSALLQRLGPALELGRSFVRPDAQRGAVALSLLWRGIGAWLVRHPEIRVLVGPVSIDRRYRDESIHMMVGHLRAHTVAAGLNSLLHPTVPLRTDPLMERIGANLADERALSQAVARLEPDARGIPVLLRQYLRLGAKVASFNVDRDFSNVVDAFIVVDLDAAGERRVARYMGREGFARWQTQQRSESRPLPA